MMSTGLLLLGAPGSGGLAITADDVKGRHAPRSVVIGCSPCPHNNSGTVLMAGARGLQQVSYTRRYPTILPAAARPAAAVLPEGVMVLMFDSPADAKAWYRRLKRRLGLHVAYFFTDAETPVFAEPATLPKARGRRGG